MAITSNTYTGDGSNKLFSITFLYIETTDVDVYLNGTLQTITTHYSFANATTIEFVAAPANGAVVLLDRSTNDAVRRATFFPGSSVRATDLNDNFNQALYVVQEINNKAVKIDDPLYVNKTYIDAVDGTKVNKSGDTMSGVLNMSTNKITGLGNPTNVQDAATKIYVDNTTATVTVGSVTTGETGSNAVVTNVGTANAAILNFTLPRGATGIGIPFPLLQPTTLLSTPLSSYVAPTIGTATLGFSRNFGVSQQTSTVGVWSDAGHQTAAYTYDFALGANRYKSTETRVSLITFGNARDLTQASWTKTGATATLNQTGIMNDANAASLLTATLVGATAIYSLGTLAAATRTFSVYLKRVAGSGRIWITRNGGTNWQDVTSQVNTGAWNRVQLTTSVANPSVGIQLETIGDSVAVDTAADVPGSEIFDPFISRSDQQNSILTLSSIQPTLATGRRFAVGIRARIKNSGSSLQVSVEDAAAANTIRILRDSSSGLGSIASFSGGVLKYNNGSQGIAMQANQDYAIDLLWGGRRIDLVQNGTLTASLDSNLADPAGTLSKVILTGDAEIANLVVRELRSHNIALVGDSITYEANYVKIFRRQLDPYAYTVANRGVAGNIITDVTARVSTDVTPAFMTRASSNIVLLWIGTNSLAANVSSATALTQLATLISTIKAGASWNQVLCITTLKRGGGFSNGATSGSFETARIAYNAGLAAAGADGVIAIDGVTEASDPSNTNWFDSFQIHPRAELYEVFWPIIRSALP